MILYFCDRSPKGTSTEKRFVLAKHLPIAFYIHEKESGLSKWLLLHMKVVEFAFHLGSFPFPITAER